MFGVVSRLRRAKRKASLSILKRKKIEVDLQGRALFLTPSWRGSVTRDKQNEKKRR
jgi:hypothetical protein